MRSVILSQWTECRIGVMWQHLGVLTTTRAREFWIWIDTLTLKSSGMARVHSFTCHPHLTQDWDEPYLPSLLSDRASPPFDRYQIIPRDNRGTCVWTPCPVYHYCIRSGWTLETWHILVTAAAAELPLLLTWQPWSTSDVVKGVYVTCNYNVVTCHIDSLPASGLIPRTLLSDRFFWACRFFIFSFFISLF